MATLMRCCALQFLRRGNGPRLVESLAVTGPLDAPWMSDGTSFVRGQVLLQNFRAPELLIREAHNLYDLSATPGPMEEPAAPGTRGLGILLAGWLDVTPEPARLSLPPALPGVQRGSRRPNLFPPKRNWRAPSASAGRRRQPCLLHPA